MIACAGKLDWQGADGGALSPKDLGITVQRKLR